MNETNGFPSVIMPEEQVTVPEQPAIIDFTHEIQKNQTNSSAKVVFASVTPTQKSVLDAYILGIPFGFLGAHRFYLRQPRWGLLYLFTFGLLGIGWVSDWFRMYCLVAETNRKLTQQKHVKHIPKKSLTDAYILWFPFGLLGFHHYYLGRPLWGIGYTLTFGILGIGWIIDACRLPGMVKAANYEIESRVANTIQTEKPLKRLCDAYALGASPAGILGCHHFYLGNYGFGVFYLCTFGNFGIGWIVDWFRMPTLTKRANKRIQEGEKKLKYLDNAYLMAFPFGFLGLHNFYLRRYYWGLLYLFTLGLFGIGWIVDMFRMSCLVRQANERKMHEMQIVNSVRQTIHVGPNTHVAVTETPQQGSRPDVSFGELMAINPCQNYYQGAIVYPPQGVPVSMPHSHSLMHTSNPPAYYEAVEQGAGAPPAYGVPNPSYDNAYDASAPPYPGKDRSTV